jgi:7-cyano-7-deazaguanine synthase in queuosine biosynthesis
VYLTAAMQETYKNQDARQRRWEHSRLLKVKQSTEILEHASELELSPTVIAFVFATSFSAMKCYKLRVETVCTMCTICARQRLHLEEGFLGEQ